MMRRCRREEDFVRDLRVLRSIIKSNSTTKSSIIMDAFHYIKRLKSKLDSLNQEHIHKSISNHIPTEVMVEKNEKGFMVRIICDKGPNLLVSILQAFDEMGLDVLHAKVSCTAHSFMLEAIGEAREALDVLVVKVGVLQALENRLKQ